MILWSVRELELMIFKPWSGWSMYEYLPLENFTNRLRYLITLSTIYPDLRDCYLAKSQTAAEKYDLINDEDRVRGHIDQLNSFLTTLEEELRVKYGLKGESQGMVFVTLQDQMNIMLRFDVSRYRPIKVVWDNFLNIFFLHNWI